MSIAQASALPARPSLSSKTAPAGETIRTTQSLPKIYLAVFFELERLKVGKATPGTVGLRVRDAANKLRLRQADGVERPTTCEPTAWTVALFGGKPVLWSESEWVEHAAAGRLADNVGAKSVDRTEGKEWLRHETIREIDWRTEFHRAIRDTLEFLGHKEAEAGQPRLVPRPAVTRAGKEMR